MRKEQEIFTQVNAQNVPVSADVLDTLEQEVMNESIFREYIRELLTESVVDPKIMSMIDKLEKNGGSVEILPDRVLIWEPSENNPRRWVAMVAFETPRGAGVGPCAGADSVVTSSNAKTGLGPLAYDVAIELTGGLGLMPDRFSVSKAALAVWEKYYNDRPDVETAQTDNHRNFLTPNDGDNCDQDSSRVDAGGQSTPVSFEKSVLSKVYKKSGTPVMDELRKREMLK
jgi:hypothetical protein